MQSKETEFPSISICNVNNDLRIAPLYGLDYDDYGYRGKFVPKNFPSLNKSLDAIFNESINDNFYLLDITSKSQ